MGYGYEQERQWAIERILLDRHHGYSKDIEQRRSDAFEQVERAANWLPPSRRGQEIIRYESKVPTAWRRNSANLKLDARKRIREAVEAFIEAKTPFSLRDLAAKSKCAVNTLYKHTDLWKKAQKQIRTGRFASDLPEYNAGVGAAGLESLPPSDPSSKIAPPPGLLAARRIVYEISMRNRRDARQRGLKLADMNDLIDYRWQKSWHEIEHQDLRMLSTQLLKSYLVVIGSLLVNAPDKEAEEQIRVRLKFAKAELDCRFGDRASLDYT
jgi:hypothetical protein